MPVLTAEHEGSAKCAAKNNDAGKSTKWVQRRGVAGEGSKEKRRENRGAPPMAGAPPLPVMPQAGLLQRGEHERAGQVRNGHGKRPAEEAEGGGSGQGPPALREEPMAM